MDKKQFCLFLIVALFGGLIGGFLSGKVFTDNMAFAQGDKKPKIIEANEFRVIDQDGKTHATLGMKIGRWGNRLYETGHLNIKGHNGEVMINSVGINAKGKNTSMWIDSSSLRVYKLDITGNTNLETIRLGNSGSLNLITSESMGPPSLIISDENSGKIRLKISIHETGEPYIELIDSEMNSRAVLGRTELYSNKTSSTEIRHESSLVLFNEKGDVLWSAP